MDEKKRYVKDKRGVVGHIEGNMFHMAGIAIGPIREDDFVPASEDEIREFKEKAIRWLKQGIQNQIEKKKAAIEESDDKIAALRSKIKALGEE